VEVRCPDATTTAHVRSLVATDLAERGAALSFEVVARAR